MYSDIGKLLLRLTIGLLMLFHGISKIRSGVDWLHEDLVSVGLPGMLKYGVYVGEVVAPLLVLAGSFSRIGGWLIVINMLFALGLAHAMELGRVDDQTGAPTLELQYLYLLGAACIAMIGPGRFAINDR